MTVEYTIQNLKEELIKHIAQDDYELFYLYTFEEQRALNLIQEILDLINSQADLS